MTAIAEQVRAPGSAPTVSVCIPVFNGRQYLGETIASALAQDCPATEIIVQDNASTDGTWEYLQQLALVHPSLSVQRNPETVDMASNWNIALGRARGDYLMLLSADDLLEPGFISTCLQTMTEQQVAAVTVNHYFLRGADKTVRQMPLPAGRYENFTGAVLRHNPFSINFTLFSRSAVQRLGGSGKVFARLLTCDLDLWLRLGLSGMPLYYCSEPLASYRQHGGNLSVRRSRTMVRHVQIALLRNRRGLRTACAGAYRRKLVYFIAKALYARLRGIPQSWTDRRILRLLCREVLP